MSTTFPTTLDTAATLYDAVNNSSSTLSAGYTAGGTTLDLTSGALFPSTGGIIYVGNERTTYTGKSSNQLTGVTALLNNYPSGTTAAMYNDAEHHNVLRGAIVAVETQIGATGSVVAGTVIKRLTDVEAAASPVATQIHAATAKTVPEDADEVCLADNAGAWALKKSTWTQVKAFLKTYFDTLHVTINGALGTPTSGTLTNCTGLPVAGGGTGRATSTTAYGLIAAGTTATGAHQTLSAGATTDILVGGGAAALPAWTAASGSGAPCRVNTPTLITPVLGVATATSINKMAITAPATSSTLAVADGKTLTASNTLTLAGTDSTTMTFPPASASIGYLNVPQNSQSAAYTTVLADSGKHVLHPSADTTARTFTIDSNANVAYPIGTAITFVNQASAGVMTIAITTDTMRLAGAGTTGSRTLAANGIATALKLTSTEWIISGTGLT